MICPNCGYELSEDSNTCYECFRELPTGLADRNGKPLTIEYDRRIVNLAGYQVLVVFRKTTGDPKAAPNSTFAKFLSKPGILYSLVVGKDIEGGEETDLLFNDLWLVGGEGISVSSEEDALDWFRLALEQALIQHKSVVMKDDLGLARVTLVKR